MMKRRNRSLRSQDKNRFVRSVISRSLAMEKLEDRALRAILIVDSIGDNVDENDGVTTLREAIITSNSTVGRDSIVFGIGQGGPAVIRPLSPLPAISDSVIIDGKQVGFVTPVIEIDGSSLPLGQAIFWVTGSSVEIRSLSIHSARGVGVFLTGSHNSVIGNYIGLDASGVVDRGNLYQGIYARSESNLISGNVISGNDQHGIWIDTSSGTLNSIASNIIGTDWSGAFPIANGLNGVRIGDGANRNTVEGNVISGNRGEGVELYGVGTSSNVIIGNTVGLNAAGNAAVANLQNGIFVSAGATNNIIGGLGNTDRNIISGNMRDGVRLSGADADRNQVIGNYLGIGANGLTDLGNRAHGLNIDSDFNEVLSNVIAGNDGSGIVFNSADNNVVLGNTIGLGADGSTALGHPGVGIYVVGSGNRIGGTRGGTGNVISSSVFSGIEIIGVGSTRNLVQGNFIGTDRTGSSSRGNGSPSWINTTGGVLITDGATENVVGTDLDGSSDSEEGNLISGNRTQGVYLFNAPGNRVAGNRIGVNLEGLSALANAGSGIRINRSNFNTIGGSQLEARNTVSGNTLAGIRVESSNNNEITGNYVGTNLSGSAAVPNSLDGIQLQSGSASNKIGGPTSIPGTGLGNLISGNSQRGIAMFAAGANNTAQGNIVGLNATGNSRLPNIFQGIEVNNTSQTMVGGSSPSLRNVISANLGSLGAILLTGGISNTVQGNYIGTDISGNVALGNASDGIYIVGASNNLIGGDLPASGNLIAGNLRNGVWIQDAVAFFGLNREARNNVLKNNVIGEAANGQALGNQRNGVSISDGADGSLIESNTISNNQGSGILLLGASTIQNRIRSNSIYANALLGIDLDGDGVSPNDSDDADTGANTRLNFLVIGKVTAGANTRVTGTYQGSASTTFTLEFFANSRVDSSGFGEGERLLGTSVLTTDVSGFANFDVLLAATTSTAEFITATIQDPLGNTSEFARAVGFAPTDLTLSSNSIAENAGANAVVGTFSTVDANLAEAFTYSMVAGAGSNDNASFQIDGDQLKTVPNFDFETKSSFSIRVRTTNTVGLIFEQIFTISVTNVNEAPTSLALSTTTIAENNLVDAVIGVFSSTDPDASETFVYSLVSGLGSTDNASFTIDGDQLKANDRFDFEIQSGYAIRVRTTDAGGLWFEQTFTINIIDVDDNLAPSVSISATATDGFSGVRGQVRRFTLTTTDSAHDRRAGFTYTVDWGDGTTDVLFGGEQFEIDHQYLTAATFTISVTARDQYGAISEVAQRSLTTLISEMQGNKLAIGGTSSNDAFTLNQSLPGQFGVSLNRVLIRTFSPGADQTIALFGNSGLDTFTALNQANVWNLTGTATGRLNNLFEFDSLENLVGGNGIDDFNFANGASGFNSINSGAGVDSFNFAAQSTSVFVDLRDRSATGVSFFSNVERMVGSSANADLLVGGNVANTWTLNNADSGTLGALSFSSFENLQGGTLADTFRLSTPTARVSGWIDGGAAIDTIVAANIANAWTVNGSGQGTLNATVFREVENLTGGTDADEFMFAPSAELTGRISGGAGIDKIDLSQLNNAVEVVNSTVKSITGILVGFTGVEQVQGGSATTDQVTGSDATTSWRFNSDGQIVVSAVTYTGFEAIQGGTAIDTLTGPGIDANWNLDFQGGTLSAGGQSIRFSGIENLTGGSAIDQFTFEPSAVLLGRISGGAGSDRIDLSQRTDAIEVINDTVKSIAGVVVGFTGVEQVLGGSSAIDQVTGSDAATSWRFNSDRQIVVSAVTYPGFEIIQGGTAVDTIIGPNVDTQWTLNGLGSGSLSFGKTVQFSGIDNITGGTSSDSYEIAPTGGLSGNLNGGSGAGLNTLSYSLWNTGAVVNLANATAGNASSIGGITSNFTIVMGGSGNDTLTGSSTRSSVLIGNAGDDFLTGGSGRNILIGGVGTDTLSGLAGEDILIAGRTQHDTNRNAILSILAEWSTTLRTFSQRSDNLFGNGAGDGLNGSNYLNSESIISDPESVDTLLGGLGQDWFFADLAEVADLVSTGRAPDRLN